ncbi:hypothetical protein ABK905_19635 [Acerihabitans sp. KWT182]|uniref:Lipoprotein n=1 Tax=Acerihabitans sp. KWT182 TaxID=3157919 RepID=A0AAU7Q990_9GAMM
MDKQSPYYQQVALLISTLPVVASCALTDTSLAVNPWMPALPLNKPVPPGPTLGGGAIMIYLQVRPL